MNRRYPFTFFFSFPTIVLCLLLIVSIGCNILLIRNRWQGMRVVSVYDGDTFVLENGTRVRLMGIDAPEMGRCMASEAKSYLTRIAAGKHIRLKHGITDAYGRLVAIAIIEEPDVWMRYIIYRVRAALQLPAGAFPDPVINQTMVREGLAKYMGTDTPYRMALQSANEEARAAHRGIFSTRCLEIVSPNGCTIKGNMTDGAGVYYLPTCPYYHQVIVDTSYGDQWFCTAKDAESAGFIKSPTCN